MSIKAIFALSVSILYFGCTTVPKVTIEKPKDQELYARVSALEILSQLTLAEFAAGHKLVPLTDERLEEAIMLLKQVEPTMENDVVDLIKQHLKNAHSYAETTKKIMRKNPLP